jgi:hypothetical protein
VSDAQGERLDDFRDVSGWRGFASGEVELRLASDAGALRMDFDFKGGGGFAVARKELVRALPSSFALRLRIRGSAPHNRFELKLVDPSGRNVWWFQRDAFEFPEDWQELCIESHEFEFAWGPAGGGGIEQLGALELAIAAGPGGRGCVWFADLRLEDREYRATPQVSASSALADAGPERVFDGSRDTAWRSDPQAHHAWLCVDFGVEREFGALRIDWERAARGFELQLSDDGAAWRSAFATSRAYGPRSDLYLPDSRARFLRLELREPEGEGGFGIRELVVLPREAAKSLTRFVETLARSGRRGAYPKYFHGEATLWSTASAGDGSGVALLNEEGALEVGRAGFSLEPSLHLDGRWITWADAELEQELAGGFLPVPRSRWRAGDVTLEVTAFADPAPAAAYVRYRVESSARRRLTLFAAVRPFQVTPPWQSFEQLGGISPIRELECLRDALWVNRAIPVLALTSAGASGVAAFTEGGIERALAAGSLPRREFARDALGLASGALGWDLELEPGVPHDVFVAIPFASGENGEDPEAAIRALDPELRFERALARWRAELASPAIDADALAAQPCLGALRTALGHVLSNRDGAALQPGPRRYARAWIRDGAVMAWALLRAGMPGPARDFARWYARHQARDGSVPCCVDRNGPDRLAEHDSHGQWIFVAAEVFRHTRDRSLAAEFWPRVRSAVGYIDALRSRRLGAGYERGELRERRGLLPESVSHEGYMAHPVHAYWDDFWALRGLADAAELADVVGASGDAARIRSQRDALREAIRASLEAVIARRGIDHLPASVEWADHDPTATATALVTTDALDWLPPAALARTWDLYLDGFRRRRSGAMAWESYTPYEIRNVAALVHLGRRADAHELLDFLLDDRRPRAWNQWPEIAWRDPRSPGHLGDLPHTWIAAEYALAVLTLFAYERPTDGALVIAAGIPESWLAGGAEIRVEKLPTRYGPLSYSLRRDPDGALQLALSGDLKVPPAGVIVRPPLGAALGRVELDGKPYDRFEGDHVALEVDRGHLLMR